MPNGAYHSDSDDGPERFPHPDGYDAGLPPCDRYEVHFHYRGAAPSLNTYGNPATYVTYTARCVRGREVYVLTDPEGSQSWHNDSPFSTAAAILFHARLAAGDAPSDASYHAERRARAFAAEFLLTFPEHQPLALTPAEVEAWSVLQTLAGPPDQLTERRYRRAFAVNGTIPATRPAAALPPPPKGPTP
jgi:hypothetical protein